MNFTKVQIISALIALGAVIDTLVVFVTDNESVLSEFGITPKWASLIKLTGLLVTVFSTSLTRNKSIAGGGPKNPDPKP